MDPIRIVTFFQDVRPAEGTVLIAPDNTATPVSVVAGEGSQVAVAIAYAALRGLPALLFNPPHRAILPRDQPSIPVALTVIYDPCLHSDRQAGESWAGDGESGGSTRLCPVPGAGAGAKYLLELPGVAAALMDPDLETVGQRALQLRSILRRMRRQWVTAAAPFLYALAQRLDQTRRLSVAIALMRRASALDPRAPHLAHYHGELLTRAGRISEALDALTRAATEQPSVWSYWLHISETAEAGLAAGLHCDGGGRRDLWTVALDSACRAVQAAPNAQTSAHLARLAIAKRPPVASPTMMPNIDGLGWWQELVRQEAIAPRMAMVLASLARPDDALAIRDLLHQVRLGWIAPNALTLDTILDCICTDHLIRLRHGTLEYASRGSLKVLVEEILLRDEYRFPTTNPDPRVIDGGVNFGMSIYATKAQYPSARIIGFEPNPEMHALALANVARNRWQDVSVHLAALGDEDGEALFHVSPEDDMAGAMAKVARFHATTAFTVRVCRLGSWLQEPIDFLKLDIEGAEHLVISDIASNLYRVKSLFCEYHYVPGAPAGRLEDILVPLGRAGFQTHVARSPWVDRRYPNDPGATALLPHSLSIYARRALPDLPRDFSSI